MPRNDEQFAVLADRDGDQVALTGVNVKGRLRDLMAEVEVEQCYHNRRDTNIEAVYTFPLPIGAVLLSLEVEIADKKLAGSVVEKKEAERQYEDAVTDGNSAVMLEETGPGLYTASLGNIMADEKAVIRYRYGLLLSWQGEKLRFLLPTTIAPRYGNARQAGLEDHQIPTASLEVEYPLHLEVSIEGSLANAQVTSPSHALSVTRTNSGVLVQLSGKAVLDRDFVLTVQKPEAQSACFLTADGDAHVALASVCIPPLPELEAKPLSLKVVIDCSGSMAGTSIAQARKAAIEILKLLRPADQFNVTLFGNAHRHFFRGMVPASAKHIEQALKRLASLDADMGGTEMGQALAAAFKLGAGNGEPTMLLVSDGETWQYENVIAHSKTSKHRVFTVGVGTSVAEAFMQALADATGGACELVAPQEGMSERVLAQFHRLRQPELTAISIRWPAVPQWETPLPNTVFAGDTVHVFAGFTKAIEGTATLSARIGESEPIEIAANIGVTEDKSIPRLAAAKRMAFVSAEEGLQLALQYQLLSSWTNYLVIAERADKAKDLPEVNVVPQMLAAGWGGTGRVLFSKSSTDHMVACCVDSSESHPMPALIRRNRASTIDALQQNGSRYDIPAFLRKAVDSPDEAILSSKKGLSNAPHSLRERISPTGCLGESTTPPGATPATFIANLETKHALIPRQQSLAISIEQLEVLGLREGIAEHLRKLVSDTQSEASVVAAFLYALSQTALGPQFERSLKRAILKQWKDSAPATAVDDDVRELLAGVKPDEWNCLRTEAVPF